MTNARFELDNAETQFVRDQLATNPDPTPDEEAEIARQLVDHMSHQLHATALYYVRRLAGQSRRVYNAQA